MTEADATLEEARRVLRAIADLLPGAKPQFGVSQDAIAEGAGLRADTVREAVHGLWIMHAVTLTSENFKWSAPKGQLGRGRPASNGSAVRSITDKGWEMIGS